MASQVTVIGPSARRQVVKTTPGTYLSDVLEQACTKMRLDATQYGMKHNSKAVDLSRTMRLSGLTSGAKLELTLLSRSPSVVSVALQLPDGARRLDKFPSTTTLWLILRKFESGVAGGGAKENLTARGVPKQSGGSGRLYHDQPVLQIMGRDYSTFTELQKSLGQLGFNNGSVLLKLSFQVSDKPLEEAMEQMEEYFKSVEDVPSAPSAYTTPKTESTPADSSKAQDSTPSEPAASEATPQTQPEPASTEPPPADTSGMTTIGTRRTSIYRPPTSSTPHAASIEHNPSDYVPTVEHARVHQAGLVKASQNRRMPTDAELATKASERAARRAAIDSVTIKVRFPDESSTVASFGPDDTAADLYTHIEGLLRSGTTEPFEVAWNGPKGKVEVLPRNERELIGKVGMEGKVLVLVKWAEGASAEARKGASLRTEVAGLGRDIEITKAPEVAEEKEEKGKRLLGNSAPARDSGKEKKGGVPKWFKMGKK